VDCNIYVLSWRQSQIPELSPKAQNRLDLIGALSKSNQIQRELLIRFLAMAAFGMDGFVLSCLYAMLMWGNVREE
jgi:hypothetical protein